MKEQERQRRIFSEAFKREKVKMYEEKKITVLEISRLYDVTTTAVYKWIRKFGKYQAGERLVIEKQSEGAKTKELLKQVKQREQEIGRQQMELRYYQEVIRYWNKELGEDLEKKVERPL